ncbi:MAG: hypothetical protein HY669_00610 [Chloroflexi bacterium]|nr:hypothetical protein [Chloroflexota bacterium]
MINDKKPNDKPKKCALCGKELQGIAAVAHMLVAHGPPVPASRRKRRAKVVAMLPRLHRRLEEMGFAEEQAHRILRVVAEELRKLGMV